MFFKRNGSITVFICIVLAVLIPLSCVLIDLARYSMAVKQADTALKICAESMLAAYDRQLREQYGLFALYPRDTSQMEEEVFELLSDNLNAGASVDGVSELYDFKVRKVEVVPFYNLSEPNVLRQQISEFMKYRAPVQTVQEFYEKIKVMLGLIEEAETIDKKMDLDILLNDIRESLVKLHCMLNEPMKEFNLTSDGATLAGGILKKLQEYVEQTAQEVANANKEVQEIGVAQNSYINLFPLFTKAKEAYESAKKVVDRIDSRLDRKKSDLAKMEAKLAEAQEAGKPVDYTKINALKADISDLKEQYNSASNSCSEAYKEYVTLENDIEQYKSELETKLTNAINGLKPSINNCKSAQLKLDTLLDHIQIHKQFNSDIISLIDELSPKLNELEVESEELLSNDTYNDGAISDRTNGDLQKQLQCIKKETYTHIQLNLETNLQKLEVWEDNTESCLFTVVETAEQLAEVLKDAETVKAAPLSNKRYLGYDDFEVMKNSISSLDFALSDLKSPAKMNSVYSFPVYKLEPNPNEVEYNSFLKWFREKYNDYNADSGADFPEPAPENTNLKNIRKSIDSFANYIGDSTYDGEGSDLESEAKDRRENLPSFKGATSSENALIRIGKAIEESINTQIINDSPFDKSVEGLDSVNESDKNFFHYEIERILAIGRLIKDAVTDSLEGMTENLYMNEYIVSAFKSAATQHHEIEHDIGWGRPLDNTFFDIAEVEYIIFGKAQEQSNIGSAKRGVFSIRLVFNLLHIYSDADKLTAALSLASSIAGWTILGVPVVQNFLLVAWAGLESYVDVKVLTEGKKAPLIKTSASWYLGVDNLADSLKDIFLKDFKNFIGEKLEDTIDDASEAIQETVTGIIDAKIDKAFSKVEKTADQFLHQTESAAIEEVDTLLGNCLSTLTFDNLDIFAESLGAAMEAFIKDNLQKLESYGQEKLAEVKNSLKARIKTLIFQSSLYKAMADKLKSWGNELLDKGINAAEGQVDQVFGKIGGSGRNNITGKLIMMDYADYMRLMLIAVPGNIKALRTSDLMQLNMQEVANEYDKSMDQYKSYIFIRADLDFKTWFLPEALFKNNNKGMISVEWSQGY